MNAGAKLCHLIKVTHREFENERNTLLREFGLTDSQAEVLGYLTYVAGGQATQHEICDFMHTSGATVSGLVTRLERKGFVERVENGADHRSNLVRVTNVALDSASECFERLESVNERLLRGFTDQERNNLMSYLERIVENTE